MPFIKISDERYINTEHITHIKLIPDIDTQRLFHPDAYLTRTVAASPITPPYALIYFHSADKPVICLIEAAQYLLQACDVDEGFSPGAPPDVSLTTSVAQLLRDKLHGLTAEQIARTLDADHADVASALLNLEIEGVVKVHTHNNTQLYYHVGGSVKDTPEW